MRSSMYSSKLYQVHKLLGITGSSIPVTELAIKILDKNGNKRPALMTRKIANRIVYEYMQKTGIVYSHKIRNESNGKHYVYIIQQDGGDRHIKIGMASDVDRRLNELRTASPHPLIVIAKICTESRSHSNALEKTLHERFRKYRLEGEWFSNDCLSIMKTIANPS